MSMEEVINVFGTVDNISISYQHSKYVPIEKNTASTLSSSVLVAVGCMQNMHMPKAMANGYVGPSPSATLFVVPLCEFADIK